MTLSVYERASNADPRLAVGGNPTSVALASPSSPTGKRPSRRTRDCGVVVMPKLLAAGTATCEVPEGCVSPWGGFTSTDLGDSGVDGRMRHIVRTATGEIYPGDLIDDILEYRRLRTLQLSRSGPYDEAKLEHLEARLRAVPREDGGQNVRAYQRFDLELRAKLRQAKHGESVLSDVATINVSAGGVKISLDAIPPAGERVWLLLPHNDSLVILPSRVAWARGTSAGLMFAGAPTTRPRKAKRR